MDTLRITLTPDDNGTFLVRCPALPEVATFGESEEACLRLGRAAIAEAIAARLAQGVRLPSEDCIAPAIGADRVLLVSLSSAP